MALTKHEGLEAIRSYRRGVTLKTLSVALEVKQHQNVYYKLGVWALNHATLPKETAAR